MKEIQIGAGAGAEETVTSENTALRAGSGDLEVYATPMMTALMEKAAAEAVRPFLEGDETTVGTMISISHSSATPVGMKVKAYAEVTEVNGREIVFAVRAEDECGPIGKGMHKRFVVYSERFMQKTGDKLNK
ncbi:MAG: thioesterase family protein [Porcipelethomonas sp.]